MTKYVINSGGLRNFPKKAEKFFNELIKDQGNNPKVLMCLFAKPREDWQEKFDEYKDGLIQNPPKGVKPEYQWAYPHTFEEQLKWCDVLYIWGGDDTLIQAWLSKFDLPKIWDGKVVGTNSASTHALSKHFWTCDWRMLMDGLGIVPIKTIAHFKSTYGEDDDRGPIDWDAAYKELEKHGDTSLPIHALKEGDFIIINQ